MSALTAGQLATLRTTRHATRLALAVYAPATIWTGRVNGDHAIRATSIAFNTGSGTTPAANYEIWFGSTSGAKNIGVGRVKTHPGGASGTLTIAPNNFDLSNGDYITVKANIQPQAVQPNCGTTIYEDWDAAYTDQNLYPRPLARMGPPACAYIDPATGLATLKFYSSSVAMYGSLTAYLWTLPGATFTSGSDTAAGTSASPNVVTWDTAGQYWCSLRVTDSRGNTHTTYRPVFIFDRFSGTLPHTGIDVGALEGSQDGGGWTTTLTVRGTADASAFPDLAQIVLFARDFYDDTETSIGGDYVWRENIVFVGFIRAGSVKAHAWNKSVEFQAVGIGVLAENLPGYAFNLDSGSTGWHSIPSMTYALAAYHILTEHSTLDLIADVDLSPVNYTAQKIDFVASSLRDQIAQQCLAPVRSLFGSSRTGRIYARQNPQLVAAASRTEDVVLDTDDADFRDTVDIVQERTLKETAQLDFNGFNFTGAGEQTPVLSLAPGSPYTNGRFERLDGIRVTDQSDSNIISGYFEGRANNAYPDIALRWRGNYRVFDAFPIEKIRLNLTTAQNNRGLAWSNVALWIKRVAMTYRNGSLVVDTNCEMDVVGAPGITGNYPSVPPTVEPPIQPPPPVDPPPVDPPPTRPPGRGARIYVSSGKGVARGTNATFPAGDYTWAAINSGLTTAAEKNVYGINFDPFSHDNTQFTKMWAMTEAGLYLCSGLDGSPTWSAKLTPANVETLLSAGAGTGRIARLFSPSVLTQNQIVTLVASDPGAGRWTWYWCYSNDNGATWTVDTSKWYVNNGAAETNSGSIAPSFHTAGVYYLIGCGIQTDNTYYPANYPAPTPAILKCATISSQFVPVYGDDSYTPVNGAPTYFPYCNTAGVVYANDNVAFMHLQGMANGADYMSRFASLFSPAWSAGYTPPTSVARGDVNMSSANGLTGVFGNPFNEQILVAFNTIEVFASQSGGASWFYYNALPQYARSVYLVPIDTQSFFIAGDSNSSGYASVHYTLDMGATWTRIDNPLGGTLDSALSLSATTQMQSAIVLVDYYKE